MTGWFSRTLSIRCVLLIAMLGAMGCFGSLVENKDLQKLKDQLRDKYGNGDVFDKYNCKTGDAKEAYRRGVMVACCRLWMRNTTATNCTCPLRVAEQMRSAI